MKQFYSIAVIGFNEADTFAVESIIEKSYLDLRVEYKIMNKLGKNLIFAFNSEVDIVILNSHGYKAPIDHIITNLKNRFPLTEVVMVDTKKDYDVAISAFRAGARDIIAYPLDEKSFLGAVERSQSYRSLLEKSTSLSEILTILSRFMNFRKFTNHDELMYRINNYAQERLDSSSLVVITFPKKVNPAIGINQSFRAYWNKRALQEEYKGEEFQEFVNGINIEELLSNYEPYIEVQIGDSYFYAVNLGEYEKYNYAAIFKIPCFAKTELVGKVVGHFCRLFQNAYNQWLFTRKENDLKSLVHIDEVTGLYNQRKLHLDLEELIYKYESYNEIFSIIFVDIDHFKTVNDGHGHLVGSKVLVEVAEIIKEALRETDYVYRYGGDEFVVIIPETDSPSAKAIGERVLSQIKSHKFKSEKKKNFSLSVSVGVAEFPIDAKTKESILELADAMMYKAKAAGRGKVCSAHELLASDKAN